MIVFNINMKQHGRTIMYYTNIEDYAAYTEDHEDNAIGVLLIEIVVITAILINLVLISILQ